ncbi:MAG: 50S ribosomal protein L23 [Bacteroidota bacterium]
MSTLKKPIINEKFAKLNETGVYGFVVDRKANKIEVRKAIEAMYSVNVESVRTLNVQGKFKSRMSKSRVMTGRTKSYKKAIVTLAKGEVIDFYNELS